MTERGRAINILLRARAEVWSDFCRACADDSPAGRFRAEDAGMAWNKLRHAIDYLGRRDV